MSMLLISAVLGVVTMVVLGACWMILRRGSAEPAPAPPRQLDAPRQRDAGHKRPAQAVSATRVSTDHLDAYGKRLTVVSRGQLASCIDDEDVELDEGLSFGAKRVEAKPRYFMPDQHPSSYELTLEGMTLDVEVRFFEVQGDEPVYIELQLRHGVGQASAPLLELFCRWLGVELTHELPFDATLDEDGRVTCELSGKYWGRADWGGRSVELFSWTLGESILNPLWFGVDHEQGHGWFWTAVDALPRLKMAHHLSIHLRGGQPLERRAQAGLSGFEDEPLVRTLTPLAVDRADELFIRGQRVAIVQEAPDDGDGFTILTMDHVSDLSARELVSSEGLFAALDLDEAGQILALMRFKTHDDDEIDMLLEVYDLRRGELLWSVSCNDSGLIYRVCVSPTGDRVAFAMQDEELDMTELLVCDARTGEELGRSQPRELLELGRWLEIGIVCSFEDEAAGPARQCVWSPDAGRWEDLPLQEVSLPQAHELFGLRDEGVELLNGQLWPYVQLDDLEVWPGLSLMSIDQLPWVGPHHLLWPAEPPVVLNVRDGSARPLLSEDLAKHFILAHGDEGIVVVSDYDDERLFWATFSVSEVGAWAGVLTGVAW